MFFNGSRYLKVKDYSVTDKNGNTHTVKRARPYRALEGDFLYQVRHGDRLDLLAYKFYRSGRKWWLICDANPDLMHPDEALQVGRILVIPKNRGL